jgi:hypothetical protein
MIDRLAAMPVWLWGIAGVAAVLSGVAIWYWNPRRRILRIMRPNDGRLPEHVIRLLSKERSRDVLELAKLNGSWAMFVAMDIWERFGLEPFIEIAKVGAAHQNGPNLVIRHLAQMGDRFQSGWDLRQYGTGLSLIAAYSKSSLLDVFNYGLASVEGLVRRFGIDPFIEVASISGPNTGRVFRYGFPLVEDRIRSAEDVRRYGYALARTAENMTPKIDELRNAEASLTEPREVDVDYGYDLGRGPQIRREWHDPDGERRGQIRQEISERESDFSGVWAIVGA